MKNIKKMISALMIGVSALLLPICAMASESGDSMQEKLAYAGRNTIIGICTVFIMLIVISLIIYCFRFLPGASGGRRKDRQDNEKISEEDETPPSPIREEAADTPAEPAVELMGDAPAAPSPVTAAPAANPFVSDTELVAVITAAIAAGAQIPPGSFVVRTIKRRI